jgi:hypothetical protein
MERYVPLAIDDPRSPASLLMRMGAKDWLIQKAAVAMLNQSVFRPYGTVKELKLDTARRTIEIEAELKGESQPVRIQIQEYEILEENGSAFVVLKGITTSREWLTTLARNYGEGRRIEIPESVRAYLPMLA